MTAEWEAFLLGIVTALTFTAALFFLKFWKKTRDQLFLAFSISFAIEGCNRMIGLFAERPNERDPWSYIVRLISFLLIIIAIVRKNYRS